MEIKNSIKNSIRNSIGDYWQLSPEKLFEEFQSSAQGLTSQQAAERLEYFGPNLLTSEKEKNLFQIFLEQFRDFLVMILLLAAFISGLLGDWESTIVILAVIILNAVLGTVQTIKASASLDSLKELSAPEAKVLRNGQLIQVPGRDIVPGDVICLEAGDAVCADGRLFDCASLQCGEGALTGESLPSEKETGVLDGDIPLGDRRNMVYSGSFVVYGRGKFLVTETGMNTEIGHIAALLNSGEGRKTPLQISLDRFGKKLSIMILVACAALFAINILWRQEPVIDAFLFAIALAVAAIPEALGSIVTIVLAFGTRKMAKERAIIRKLQAVEALGSVSIICSDKTGTLTQNQMTVRKLYTGGKILEENHQQDYFKFQDLKQDSLKGLLYAALLCSDATIGPKGEIGDPTETALVRLGKLHGLDEETVRKEYPRMNELPFDSDRKRMSTVHHISGKIIMLTKGAVDVLLDLCKITRSERLEIETINRRFSEEGLRVLAFAYRTLDETEDSAKIQELSPEDERNLIFLGLIAMMDPPREESKEAVVACISAGIRPIMITGDHLITASAIARELGILKSNSRTNSGAIEGAVLENITDEELQELVPEISVYARVSPEHKIRIVRAWQARGNLVAMTGDGVNDAPALKQADIGVAMGITGTEVAKDAAGMILADDNFATIIHAVENGRNIYANIRRAIQFLLSGNTAGILVVFYASIRGLPVPFAAVHLLFINLLTDSLPAIALGLEPHSNQVMKERPRPRNEGILTSSVLIMTLIEGTILALGTGIAFHLGLSAGGAAVGSTMAFATLCLSRLLHSFSCKSARPVIFQKAFWNNRILLLAFLLGAGLLNAVLWIPTLEPWIQVIRLPIRLFGSVLGLSFGTLAAVQLLKLLLGLFSPSSWPSRNSRDSISEPETGLKINART